MADKPKSDQPFEKAPPEKKRVSSGDHSGQGRPRRDDDVLPEGPGRQEFGTHGGPHGEGGQRQAPPQRK